MGKSVTLRSMSTLNFINSRTDALNSKQRISAGGVSSSMASQCFSVGVLAEFVVSHPRMEPMLSCVQPKHVGVTLLEGGKKLTGTNLPVSQAIPSCWLQMKI